MEQYKETMTLPRIRASIFILLSYTEYLHVNYFLPSQHALAFAYIAKTQANMYKGVSKDLLTSVLFDIN